MSHFHSSIHQRHGIQVLIYFQNEAALAAKATYSIRLQANPSPIVMIQNPKQSWSNLRLSKATQHRCLAQKLVVLLPCRPARTFLAFLGDQDGDVEVAATRIDVHVLYGDKGGAVV